MCSLSAYWAHLTGFDRSNSNPSSTYAQRNWVPMPTRDGVWLVSSTRVSTARREQRAAESTHRHGRRADQRAYRADAAGARPERTQSPACRTRAKKPRSAVRRVGKSPACSSGCKLRLATRCGAWPCGAGGQRPTGPRAEAGAGRGAAWFRWFRPCAATSQAHADDRHEFMERTTGTARTGTEDAQFPWWSPGRTN